MKELKIEQITVVDNYRKHLGNIEELAKSIKEHGILCPLIVNDDYQLVAGHRRLGAARHLGLKSVPVIVTSCDEAGQAEIQLIENLQRKDIDPLEEAESFVKYIAHMKCKAEDLRTAIKEVWKPGVVPKSLTL